ncbi:MAG: tetratricopeptide repeat protein, partial [Pseudomonadales bacterium]
MKLIGAINPLRPKPCFSIPLFEEKGTLYTQMLRQGNTIKGFQEFECENTVYTPIENGDSYAIDDDALQVFDVGVGNFLIGDKRILSSKLTKLSDNFFKTPFLLKEIGEYLSDDTILGRANALIETKVKNTADTKKLENTKADAIGIEETIARLTTSLEEGEISVLAGAGISYHSGLPVVEQLVPAILRKIGMSEDEQRYLMNSNMPFERFIEILRGDSIIDPIFNIYEEGKPNTTHRLLAKLMVQKHIRTICTTNFDRLIEASLHEEGWLEGKNYEVIYREDEFEQLDLNDSFPRVIKLHGGVQDKENMAITLSQVSQKQLSQARQRVIKHLFSDGPHKQVLMLGYSSSDIFDITPHIQDLSAKGKSVTYIEHSVDVAKLEPIQRKERNNPFKQFEQGIRLYYNTDALVESLWSKFAKGEVYEMRQITTEWTERVEEWYLKSKDGAEAFDYGLCAHLFFRLADFSRARRFWLEASELSLSVGDKKRHGTFLGNLGLVSDSMGDYQSALDYYNRALSISQELKDRKSQILNMANVGNVRAKIGDFQYAIDLLKQAYQIAQKINDIKKTATILANLGSVYLLWAQFESAISCFEDSLVMAQQIGDLDIEKVCLGNLGNTYRNLSRFATAKNYLQGALKIARQIGDRAEEGIWLGNLGVVHGQL